MKISEIQESIRQMLLATPQAASGAVGVVCADDGNAVSAVEQALADGGLVAVVLAPKFMPTSTASKRSVGDLSCIVRVLETPAVNRERAGYVRGSDFAEYVAVRLNLARPSEEADLLVLDKPGISASSENGETVAWDVPFKTVHQLDDLVATQGE